MGGSNALHTDAHGRLSERDSIGHDQVRVVAFNDIDSALEVFDREVHSSSPERLWWDLYSGGVLTAVNGLACLSTPMDETVVDAAIAIYDSLGPDDH